MTALVVSRPDMPGYTSLDMDDVHTPPSELSFYHPSVASTGMFAFPSQTGPSTDHMSGSSWDTTAEGAQNFHPDLLDNGSSHTGETEDFHFAFDGHLTPRGQSQPNTGEDMQVKWSSLPTAPMAGPIGGEPMRRGNSRASAGSHKHRISKPSSKARTSAVSSQIHSHLSAMDITGNASVFSNGSNAPMVGVAPCLYLGSGSEAAGGVSPHMLYPDMSLDMTIGPDGLPSPPTELAIHVVPAQMQRDPDTSLTAHSDSSSWASFRSPESHLSSPAGSPEEARLPDPLITSPPRSDNGSPVIQGLHWTDDSYPGQPMMTGDLSGPGVGVVGDDYSLPPSYTARRPGNEGESARDNPLYKNVSPGPDGLFHCPWEGESSCNHKPEKLKCNYDKFVDSHLKPYRCKDVSCESARFSSTACLLRHEREAHAMHGHGDKPFLCRYQGCDRAVDGCGFPRQWNLRDHMRRVHNDNRPPGSPTGQAQNQQSTKGRKRKDAPKAASVAGRKSSAKANAVEAATKEEQAARPLIEEWMANQEALKEVTQGFTGHPQDAKNAHLIKKAQNLLTTMSKMTNSATAQPATVPLRRNTYTSTG